MNFKKIADTSFNYSFPIKDQILKRCDILKSNLDIFCLISKNS